MVIRLSPAEVRGLIRSRTAKPRTDWADVLLLQIRALHLPEPVTEYRFHGPAGRRWRFDCAWLPLMLAVETDGSEWTQGRHNRGAGMAADNEKLNTAALEGWTVLRFTGSQVRSGAAIGVLEPILKG